MTSPWSLSASGGGSPWSASRVGLAAAAITPTGAIPPFGAALDLSTLQIDNEAFAEWARLQAEISRRLEADPEDDKAKVALAVSLMLAGDPEWKNLIENVLATSTDQVAREGATGLIQYLSTLNVQ